MANQANGFRLGIENYCTTTFAHKKTCDKYYLSLHIQTRSSKIPAALSFKCGFARVAIRELFPSHERKALMTEMRVECEEKFKLLFEDIISPESNYYICKQSRVSQFQHHCNYTIQTFQKRWHPDSARENYTLTFST